jgi:hypothetical protein
MGQLATKFDNRRVTFRTLANASERKSKPNLSLAEHPNN